MGCLQSREKKSYEQILYNIDLQLRFNQISLETLKTVFKLKMLLISKNLLVF